MVNDTPQHAYEDAPLRPFHYRVAVATVTGQFSDGFGLGIIGLSLSLAAPTLGIDALWMGILGGAALAGLFFGALIAGPVSDHFGRRLLFAGTMGFIGLFSIGQFLVETPVELLLLRLGIGFMLGVDYVVGKAMLAEFTPRAARGRIMSTLAIAWAGGFSVAYGVGFLLSDIGAEPWRWMLLSAAVPALLAFPLRLSIPESPMWLAAHGRDAEAAAIVARRIGADVRPPTPTPPVPRVRGRWAELLSPAWRRNTLTGAIFFTCQVVPYFALGTFVTRVLQELGSGGGLSGGLVYNLALLVGAVGGFLAVDHMPRRVFLVGSFVLTAAALLPLALVPELPIAASITLLAVFGGVLSAASSLCYVYLPELYPTTLRASGMGLAIAASRIGSATSTFLLPLIVAGFGVQTALGACAAVLVTGAVLCHLWAPETRGIALAEAR